MVIRHLGNSNKYNFRFIEASRLGEIAVTIKGPPNAGGIGLMKFSKY